MLRRVAVSLVLGAVLAIAPGPAFAADENWLLSAYSATVSTPSGEYQGRVVGRVMDEDDVSYWNSTALPSAAFLLADLGVARPVTSLYLLQGGADTTNCTSFALQTAPDNATWTTVDTFTVGSNQTTFVLDAEETARYWRIDCTGQAASMGWGVKTYHLIGDDTPAPTPTPVPTPTPSPGDTGDVVAAVDELHATLGVTTFAVVFVGSVLCLTAAWLAVSGLRR